MHTHTVTVTLGRKIGTHEMHTSRWLAYKAQVMASLRSTGCEVVQYPCGGRMRAHDQVGEWDGQREPAATFVALITGYANIAKLRRYLAHDAMLFEQDAIGCIVTLGADHLVRP